GPFVPTAFVTLPGGQEAAGLGTSAPASPGQTPTASSPNLTTFDYRLVDLQWQGERWQLVAGGVMLKDFGRRQTEAREALRIVRELRLTQHGTIGTPKPVMEYWLADGQAPRAYDPRLRLISFDPAGLRVEQVQGQWCLRDARMPLFYFGAHAE